MSGQAIFRNKARVWNAETFDHWIAAGAAAVAENSKEYPWPLAFPPLLLSPQSDPTDQIIAELNDLPQTAYQQARFAVGHLIGALPTNASPPFVEFLLKLASTLRPVGLARNVRDLLQRQSILDKIDDWRGTITTAIIAVSEYAYSEDFGDLIALLQKTAAWRPIYVRYYILAYLRSQPNGWMTLIEQFEDDLVVLRDNEPTTIEAFLKSLVKSVGPQAIWKGLPRFISGDLRQMHWIADALIGDTRAPMQIVVDGRDYKLKGGSVSSPIEMFPQGQTKSDELDWVNYVVRKAPKPSDNFDEAQNQLLKQLDAA